MLLFISLYLFHVLFLSAGADYLPDEIQFTIPPGDGPIIVPVPIIDDAIAEDPKQFLIAVLNVPQGSVGATLGKTHVILLVILDDDCEFL